MNLHLHALQNPYECGTLLLRFMKRYKNKQEAAFAACVIHRSGGENRK